MSSLASKATQQSQQSQQIQLSQLSQQSQHPQNPPNIVLILVDDLGFSDLGAYGSEIKTPNIDQLAAHGVRFSNYHTAASCAPARAMLLTGVDNHRNGVPNIPEALPPEHKKHPHYQGVLGHNVVTVATLLQQAGYHTYLSGKWHLGKRSDLMPFRRGFERTLAMMDSGSDNWQQKPYLPIYKQANWTADGQKTILPDDFYSSQLLVDRMINFIEQDKADQQPFFAYLPFMAVHLPVQAPKKFTDKYLNTYAQGWKQLRENRFSSAKNIGLVAAKSQLQHHDFVRDWHALNDDEKYKNAKRMAVYAGMVTAMDHHIGRLINYLKQRNLFNETIFIITSDNGPEATEIHSVRLRAQGYNTHSETLGEKGSFNHIGRDFASAAASPLSLFKFYSGEGGMRVPLIVSGRGVKAQSSFNPALTYVTDITPTILALTATPL
ncbi:MAG: sulfatase-like hydrolase/transferase, partial [Paraglaciecola sp.]|nr:sulfatase-like hydrolase/transferase [Paraglaciecola sp.]